MQIVENLLLFAQNRMDSEIQNEYNVNDIQYWRGYIDALNMVKKTETELKNEENNYV